MSALGIMFSPAGNNAAQVEAMLAKAEKWANRIKHSGIQRSDVWYSINPLEYPLLATTLTKKEIYHIMSPISEVGLPISGICRNNILD